MFCPVVCFICENFFDVFPLVRHKADGWGVTHTHTRVRDVCFCCWDQVQNLSTHLYHGFFQVQTLLPSPSPDPAGGGLHPGPVCPGQEAGGRKTPSHTHGVQQVRHTHTCSENLGQHATLAITVRGGTSTRGRHTPADAMATIKSRVFT